METMNNITEESMFAEDQTPPEEYIHAPEPSFSKEKIDAVFELTDSMRQQPAAKRVMPGEEPAADRGGSAQENSFSIPGMKIVQLRKVKGTEKREAVLTDFDALAPKQIYRGGNIEFMFEDRNLKERLKKGLPGGLKAKMAEGIRSGTLPLADFIESVDPKDRAGREYLKQFQFSPKEIADDLRNIKEKLAESFTAFQKERYEALASPEMDDEAARKEALSSLIRQIPEIAASHARLQVMLQGTDREREYAAAALMEAWANAMAQYRAEIDEEIASLTPEQLTKIADEMNKTYDAQFHKATNDLSNIVSNYQNDLGYVFMAAFCPPMLLLAAAPILIPFAKAGVTKFSADSKRRKSQEQYRQIDERIEIAASITSAKGVVEDWIESSLNGTLPSFLRDLAGGTESEYFKEIDRKNEGVKEVISPLLKASFEKKFEAGSPEETMFRSECAKAAALIAKLDKECSHKLERGSSYMDNLKKINKGMELDPEAPPTAKILQLVRTMSSGKIEEDGKIIQSAETSLFDVYRAYSSGELGSSAIPENDIDKGSACALSRDDMREFIRAKIASEGTMAAAGGLRKEDTVLKEINNRSDLLDLDMQLRCMVSYDTMLTTRDSHKPKAGLDYLDAAFGFEHRKDLKDDTFWGKVENSSYFTDIKRKAGDDALENLQRLMIAGAMAESYAAQLDNIRDSKIEKTYGTYLLYEYYQSAKNEIEDLKGKLGEDNLRTFSSICSDISSDAAGRAGRFDPVEYERADAISASDAGEYRQKNLDIHLAAEVAAITSAKHISEIMGGMYEIEGEEDIVKASRKGSFEFWKGYRAAAEANKGEISMDDVDILRSFTALSLAANETSLRPGIEGLSRETVGMNVRHMERFSDRTPGGPEYGSGTHKQAGGHEAYVPAGSPYEQSFEYDSEL